MPHSLVITLHFKCQGLGFDAVLDKAFNYSSKEMVITDWQGVISLFAFKHNLKSPFYAMSVAPEYNILSYPPIRVLKTNTLVMIFSQMGFLLGKGYIYVYIYIIIFYPKKTL
jgi:hypothetical protein